MPEEQVIMNYHTSLEITKKGHSEESNFIWEVVLSYSNGVVVGRGSTVLKAFKKALKEMNSDPEITEKLR